MLSHCGQTACQWPSCLPVSLFLSFSSLAPRNSFFLVIPPFPDVFPPANRTRCNRTKRKLYCKNENFYRSHLALTINMLSQTQGVMTRTSKSSRRMFFQLANYKHNIETYIIVLASIWLKWHDCTPACDLRKWRHIVSSNAATCCFTSAFSWHSLTINGVTPLKYFRAILSKFRDFPTIH